MQHAPPQRHILKIPQYVKPKFKQFARIVKLYLIADNNSYELPVRSSPWPKAWSTELHLGQLVAWTGAAAVCAVICRSLGARMRRSKKNAFTIPITVYNVKQLKKSANKVLRDSLGVKLDAHMMHVAVLSGALFILLLLLRTLFIRCRKLSRECQTLRMYQNVQRL